MDYAIGSLSDLITGSVTPNKPKVVKKQITVSESKLQITTPQSNSSEDSLKRNSVKTTDQINSVSTEKTPKKRKLLDTNENGSKPKKSKNSENAERRITQKVKNEKREEDPELLSRTVFVGNLPVALNTKKFKKLFAKYGNIEAVRIRGVPIADPKTSKKVALIKKEFHPERKSFHGYVRFEKREDAVKATEMNSTIYQDHHLRVCLCDVDDKPDESKAIFIGNLSFYAEEDDLWKLFESCGSVASVRIIRDGKTGIGKGFGYVNFHNSDAVSLALEMENVQLKGRELRISICNLGAAKKNKKNNKVKKIVKPGKPKGFKKMNKGGKEVHDGEVLKEALQDDKRKVNKSEKPKDFKKMSKENEEKVKNSDQTKEFNNKPFQGVKFADKKKKSKLNKGLLQKKKIIKKVAPK